MASLPGDEHVRLLHVANYGGPYRGSFISTVTSVLEAAQSRGWEVEALMSPPHDREWVSEFAERDIPLSFLAPKPTRTAVQELRRRFGPDRTIVHTHFSHFDIAAAMASRHRDVGLVWHSHESSPVGFRRKLRRRVKFGLAGGRVSTVLAVSRDTASDLRGARVIAQERVLHLPNAIDLSAFQLVDSACRVAAKEALGLDPDVPVVLHFGRDWQIKGGDVFLRAVARLQRDAVRCVGMTVWADEYARAEASALGVANAVRFQPPTHDVQQLYAASDVCISCSRQEGDPFAVLEALSSGLGVVVASPYGLAVPPVPSVIEVAFEPDAISNGVRRLLARSNEAVRADAAATRVWAERNIGLDAYAATVIGVYEALLAGRVPRIEARLETRAADSAPAVPPADAASPGGRHSNEGFDLEAKRSRVSE